MEALICTVCGKPAEAKNMLGGGAFCNTCYDDQLTGEDHNEIITCWCGAQGTMDELFADECLEGGCGGTGTRQCFCGGDLCVCHHHGEIDCDGCEDCDFDEDRDDWYEDDYDVG